MLCVKNRSIDVLGRECANMIIKFATGPFFFKFFFLEESFMKAMENIFGISIAFY